MYHGNMRNCAPVGLGAPRPMPTAKPTLPTEPQGRAPAPAASPLIAPVNVAAAGPQSLAEFAALPQEQRKKWLDTVMANAKVQTYMAARSAQTDATAAALLAEANVTIWEGQTAAVKSYLSSAFQFANSSQALDELRKKWNTLADAFVQVAIKAATDAWQASKSSQSIYGKDGLTTDPLKAALFLYLNGTKWELPASSAQEAGSKRVQLPTITLPATPDKPAVQVSVFGVATPQMWGLSGTGEKLALWMQNWSQITSSAGLSPPLWPAVADFLTSQVLPVLIPLEVQERFIGKGPYSLKDVQATLPIYEKNVAAYKAELAQAQTHEIAMVNSALAYLSAIAPPWFGALAANLADQKAALALAAVKAEVASKLAKAGIHACGGNADVVQLAAFVGTVAGGSSGTEQSATQVATQLVARQGAAGVDGAKASINAAGTSTSDAVALVDAAKSGAAASGVTATSSADEAAATAAIATAKDAQKQAQDAAAAQAAELKKATDAAGVVDPHVDETLKDNPQAPTAPVKQDVGILGWAAAAAAAITIAKALV